MELYHVVAMAHNRVIGRDNQLPWHFSSDMKHFKELTMGSTVIMGRRTFESLGKRLPGRQNFILSLTQKSNQGEVRFFSSFERALQHVATPKVFIIGGAQIFKETLSRMDGIYLTQIDADYEGDAFYPEIPASFKEISRRLLQDPPKIEVIFYQNTLPPEERKKTK